MCSLWNLVRIQITPPKNIIDIDKMPKIVYFKRKSGDCMEFKEEIATIEDIAVDGIKRYENAILTNIPANLSSKGIVAVRTFLNYMDNEMVSEFTGKKTYLNVEESYLSSGVYSDEHLKEVYEVEVIESIDVNPKTGDSRVIYTNKYKVLNKREDLRLKAEALRFWQENNLSNHFSEMLDLKRGGVPFEELLKATIQTDALKEGDVQNRKMAMDIHGMKNKNNKQTINVYVEGGGKKMVQEMSYSSNNKFLDLGLEDEDE